MLDVGLGVMPHQLCCGEDVHPDTALVSSVCVAMLQAVRGEPLGCLLERLSDVVAFSVFEPVELLGELIAARFHCSDDLPLAPCVFKRLWGLRGGFCCFARVWEPPMAEASGLGDQKPRPSRSRIFKRSC